MKQTLRQISLVTLFATVLVLGLMPNVQAREKCTEATLEGSYGHVITGTRFDLEGALVTNVGIVVYDGKGNETTSVTLTINGEVARRVVDPPDPPRTYTVNENCTGTIYNADGTPAWDIVIVGGGKEILYINILGDRTMNGVGKKQ